MPNSNSLETGRESDTPRPIESVSVIGAGVMGRGIALANAERNLSVTLNDASSEILEDALKELLEELRAGPATGQSTANRDKPAIVGSMSFGELARADLVVETAVEKLNVKRKILRQLEPGLGDETIIASNTSTIPISEVAAKFSHAQRVCGLHFCHPVRQSGLVEVIRAKQTSGETIKRAARYVQSIGRLPIVVQDCPGFLVNRLLAVYLNESLELLLEGAQITAVEAAAISFGMRMGPLSQLDAFGLDVAIRAGARLVAAFPDRYVVSELLPDLYVTGRLGQKSGAGFFCYQNETRTPTPDAAVEELIRKRLRGERRFTPRELTLRLLLPMLLEATRILQEGLVPRARDVDLGLINGIGFPAARGGLLAWADTLGAAKVIKLLKPLRKVGKRFEPTELLLDMAKRDRHFYDVPPSSLPLELYPRSPDDGLVGPGTELSGDPSA